MGCVLATPHERELRRASRARRGVLLSRIPPLIRRSPAPLVVPADPCVEPLGISLAKQLRHPTATRSRRSSASKEESHEPHIISSTRRSPDPIVDPHRCLCGGNGRK